MILNRFHEALLIIQNVPVSLLGYFHPASPFSAASPGAACPKAIALRAGTALLRQCIIGNVDAQRLFHLGIYGSVEDARADRNVTLVDMEDCNLHPFLEMADADRLPR